MVEVCEVFLDPSFSALIDEMRSYVADSCEVF